MPYFSAAEADWSHAVEVERKPCGKRSCVVLQVHLRPDAVTPGRLKGSAMVTFDLESGLIVAMTLVQFVSGQRVPVEVDISYTMRTSTVRDAADMSLFKVPDGLREVKEFSKWNAGRIRQELVGKPAPDLIATDIQGAEFKLSSLKGKVVLLDFWTTWCPPCRADGPALDKLYRKYAAKDLAIVGINVNEDRQLVEHYLTEHPHAFPIALTSENDLPTIYRVSALPTYIVIGKDGTVAFATQGDQGFGELWKQLKKAGMEVE